MMKTIQLMFLIAAMAVATGISAQELKIDTQQSQLQWVGKKVTGEHTGYVALKEAKLKIKDDQIVSGKVVIDMNSISNTDLTNQEYNQKLVGHLKSDDFFSVEKFPTAELAIVESSKPVNGEMTVKGNLTIKGITKPIEFKAKKTETGYTARIVINRAKYDVRYGSSSFFEGLGDKVIYDDFEINAVLVSDRT
jgi:polyisoprenoid-binding protein YceI